MATSSTAGLLVSLSAFCLYSYSLYCLSQLRVQKGFSNIFPPELQAYGLFKFLTIQCLIIQIVSTLLHVLAHFIKPLRGARDLVFTVFAVPIGSIVVYSFWLVWFLMGREKIFPVQLDAFYPSWLNHSTHTIIAPVNILLSVLVSHRFMKGGVLVSLIYMLMYSIMLQVIKAQTGRFVYPYLEKLNDVERLVYYAGTGVFTYLMYKSGQLIQNLVHGRDRHTAGDRKPPSKGQKQK